MHFLVFNQVLKLHFVEPGRHEFAVEQQGFTGFQFGDAPAERLVRDDAGIDDNVLILNMNREFFLQILLRDIRSCAAQQTLPFFAQGQDAHAQFTHRAGGREGQEMVASVGVEEDDVHFVVGCSLFVLGSWFPAALITENQQLTTKNFE